MAAGSKVGLDIDLKKIPIRQETVEVCEALGLNPYILMSSGSMMIAVPDGYGLVPKAEWRESMPQWWERPQQEMTGF